MKLKHVLFIRSNSRSQIIIISKYKDFFDSVFNICIHYPFRSAYLPQLGPIIIGERVWIGSNSSVERSELKKTIIQSDVKIDDQVHIGAGVSILEDIKLENNVMVGQGGVVLHNLDSEGVYVGIPARFLKRRGI